MDRQDLPTMFAPAERATDDDLLRQRETFANQRQSQPLLEAIPEVFLILNDQRQIVYSNQSLLDLLGVSNRDKVCGFRPGEVLNCSHAYDMEGGCGTSEFCQTCGAAQAILSSLRGEPCIQECRILQKGSGDALDFRVWATPYRMNGHIYSIFVVNDISHEKRRKSLERIFYHDVLNTAGILLGFAGLLRDADAAKSEMIRERIYRLSLKLIDEINAQRELTAAENNELTARMVPLQSRVLLEEIAGEYKDHELSKNRSIRIDERATNTEFQSDRTLLYRVISNLVKNALESSQAGETVTLQCEADEECIQFSVHNPGCMPRPVQLQVFQRSFSTKGTDRGLGTYSIKLLSERYLKGNVSFTSTPEEGTMFIVRYPLHLT